MNSYLLLTNSLVVVTGGKQYTVDNTHPNYKRVLDAIKAATWDEIPGLVDLGNFINANGKDKITVRGGVVMYGANEVHNVLTERLLAMLGEGFNVDPMVALLENLMANPTKTAIDEFYLFIEGSKLPITEDGCILAYKRVDDNYLDCYTHTVMNKPYSIMSIDEAGDGPWVAGQVTTEIVDGYTVVSMPRQAVDADRSRDCSVGLHFCSLEYLGNFNRGTGNIIIVKINPADIVAIPYDYNNTKGRCWKYTIISSLEIGKTKNLNEEVYTTSVVPAAVVTDEHKQYDAGYRDGRNKAPNASDTFQSAAYDLGYKHGRGKQKRKFPAIKAN